MTAARPEPAEQVAARLPAVEADEVAGPHVDRRPADVVEQVERESDRDEGQGDAGELVGEVEPGPSRGRGLVHRRRLLRQRDRAGQLLDDAEHGVDGRRPEADAEDEDRLPAEPAPDGRVRDGGGVALRGRRAVRQTVRAPRSLGSTWRQRNFATGRRAGRPAYCRCHVAARGVGVGAARGGRPRLPDVSPRQRPGRHRHPREPGPHARGHRLR